jgi:uncharacterized protein YycO
MSAAIKEMTGFCHGLIWTAHKNLNGSDLINRGKFLFFIL